MARNISANFPLYLTFHYLFNVKLHIKKEKLSAGLEGSVSSF